MKKHNRQQRRQRQKMTLKTIMVLCASVVSFIIIGITIFIHMSNVSETKASGTNQYIVPDQEFITQKSIEAPVIVRHQAVNSNTIYARPLKTTDGKENK